MRKICSKCEIEKDFLEFSTNNSRKDGKRSECKICQKKVWNSYYKLTENKEKRERYITEYNKNFSEKVKTRRNKWFRKRNQEDILFKLKRNLSKRIWKIVKGKSKRTDEILGISLAEFQCYLEKKFTDGMCWENYGKWEIDHIVPISSAGSEKEVYELCFYTNLQPLWKLDNIKKNNKIMVR
jgi:hypothetical protein